MKVTNDAGEVVHRHAVVTARRWIHKGAPTRIHSAARSPRAQPAPYASWLYLLDISQKLWYAERRLVPIVGTEGELSEEARLVETPA